MIYSDSIAGPQDPTLSFRYHSVKYKYKISQKPIQVTHPPGPKVIFVWGAFNRRSWRFPCSSSPYDVYANAVAFGWNAWRKPCIKVGWDPQSVLKWVYIYIGVSPIFSSIQASLLPRLKTFDRMWRAFFYSTIWLTIAWLLSFTKLFHLLQKHAYLFLAFET